MKDKFLLVVGAVAMGVLALGCAESVTGKKDRSSKKDGQTNVGLEPSTSGPDLPGGNQDAVLGTPDGAKAPDRAKVPDKSVIVMPDAVVVKKDTATTKSDTTVKKDTTVVKKDTAVKPPDGPAGCGTPYQAKVNTGKSCTTDPGLCSIDEVCVGGFKNAAGATVAMCLGKCCANEANPADPVNTCPSTSPSTMFTICGLGIIGETYMSCAYVCEIPGTPQPIKFDCPTAAGFDCVAVFASDPTTKFCVPKQ